MTDLPAPFTPADCDLRGFEWMALHGHRLFTSGWYLASLKDPRGGIAALKLWWAAMLQCPAGSLPSDEEELCLLADFGQDMKAWKKHRVVAMRGFVLCQDNRYYHPVVAEQAIKAWECRRKAQHNRDGSAQRMRQMRERANGSHPPQEPDRWKVPRPEDVTRNMAATDAVTERVTPPSRDGHVARLTVQDKTEPVQEERKEVYSNSLISPVLARVAAACETPPEGTYGAEPTNPATQIAVKNIVGKLGRKFDANANETVFAQGKRPKLTVIQQQDYALHGPVIDDDTLVGELLPPLRRGPVDPQRTVAEQLAALGFPGHAA